MIPEATEILASLQVVSDSVLEMFQEEWIGDAPPIDEPLASIGARLVDIGRYARLLLGIGASVFLSSAIAFHPQTWRRALGSGELEHPSTLLIYGIVGAIVAQIVVISPPMALVVFGIGGLLRFRTDVGAAHRTGEVILVTVIGITCGMGLYPLAIVGTGSGWLLLYFLGRRSLSRLEAKEIDPSRLDDAVRAYERTLEEHGFSVVRRRRHYSRGRFVLVLAGPHGLDRDAADAALAALDPELRGEPAWDSR